MIGERQLAGRSASATVARKQRTSVRARISSRPALAGRQRLLTMVESSVLTQLVVVMGLFAAAALLYLAQASQASVIEFNIAALQQQQSRLAITSASLHATAAGLQTPQRIAAAATTRLHMGPSTGQTPIWITPILPHVATVPALNADTNQAMQQSEPASWLRRAFETVKSSL